MNMTRYKYRDFYGCEANLTEYADGTTRLIIYGWHGEVVHDKTYRSFRGARIAMGKLSDCWEKI